MRRIAPDAVIVRPPVVYGPRDTDVFQLLKSISKGLVLEIAGGERWFSAIYVEDLVDGADRRRASSRSRGPRLTFCRIAKPSSWSELASRSGPIMRRRPRVSACPLPVAHAVGYCAELWSRVTRKPGIISREKIARSALPLLDLRHPPRRRRTGFRGRTPSRRRPGQDARLVQGGRLAEVLDAARRLDQRSSGR